jgi:hypothetical protein
MLTTSQLPCLTPSSYYADALQQTWLHFSKHICTTYDPDRASVVTWLNT